LRFNLSILSEVWLLNFLRSKWYQDVPRQTLLLTGALLKIHVKELKKQFNFSSKKRWFLPNLICFFLYHSHVARNIFSMRTSQNHCKLLCLGFAFRVRGCGVVLKWAATSWIIRQQGWPPSPLLQKVSLKVAPGDRTWLLSKE
jgi:hypothetical protein